MAGKRTNNKMESLWYEKKVGLPFTVCVIKLSFYNKNVIWLTRKSKVIAITRFTQCSYEERHKNAKLSMNKFHGEFDL